MERLQKYMAACGVASRRKCEELIQSGAVKVNGQVVTEMGKQIDPKVDVVQVNEQIIHLEEKVYIVLNKPRGYVTTASDPQDRKIVLDLLKDEKNRVYPVGRLDIDTSGLLILTNDGALAQRLAHPSFEIDKIYIAHIEGIPSEELLTKLESGVLLEDGITAPAKVKVIKTDKDTSIIEITIHEGRNRQVRRMFESIGHPVIKLTREKVGFLSVEGLRPGQYRYLEANELADLMKLLRS